MQTKSNKFKNGHVVVTGGSGAIGSRLVRRLLKEPLDRLVVIDDFSSGSRWLLPGDPRLVVVDADVNSLPDLALEVQNPIVFHLAALFANQNSVDHPLEDLRVNGAGTLQALLWSQQQRARRFVYASAGCSVAGHDIEGPIHEHLPPSLHHHTPYQVTKLLGELYCNYFSRQLSTVRCRFFNAFGPGEVPGSYRNVIPNFFWEALHGRPLEITGTGEETRDFVFVDDLVEGLVLAATVAEADGLALNLGTGQPTRIIDLAEAINTLCGSHSDIRITKRRHWDHSSHRCADISLARKVLGFAPRTDFNSGLEQTAAWFDQNRMSITRTIDGRRAGPGSHV